MSAFIKSNRVVCIGLLGASALSGSLFAQNTVTLDAADIGRVYEGIGAASAGASSRLLIDYPEPQRSDILDYLFKPGYGAALQHLKVEVGSDVNSTDGSEPSHMRSSTDKDYNRGYEWWLMEEAKKRNPSILLDILPWGSPGWVGDGNLYSADMAKYMVDFIQGAQTAHHLHIDYVGVWNERPYDGTYVKELAHALSSAKLDTKIICCDAYPGLQFGEWAILYGMKKDPNLEKAVYAIGVHYPNQSHADGTPAEALNSGKSLWSSEDQPNPGGGPFLSREWALGGRVLAKQYISNYLDRKFTKTEIWSPITSYYDILAAPNSGLMYANTPWSGHYDVQSTIWVTAHTTQFAQPGWQYLDKASGRIGKTVSYVSLRSPDKKDWSVILETIDATESTTISFSVAGGLTASKVYIWETNDNRTFEKVADVNAHEGKFSFTFEPGSLYSLTTTTGQGHHQAKVPPASPFPFPYTEDFAKTAEGKSPRFLADQDGAFEVNDCKGRAGKCLVQQIERKPTPWSPLPNPFTLAGDLKWRDYAVDVDVQIPRFGVATVMGRIESADVFQDSAALNPSGYVLTLSSDGKWQILATAYKKADKVLAFGDAGDLSTGWHHARLSFRESTITAELDHQVLKTIKDTEHPTGMMALGSTWSKVQFANLAVQSR